MGLREDIPLIVKEYNASKERLKHNARLFKIYEGDLKTEIVAALKSYLSDKSFEQAISHIAPINLLKRVADKLSKLYSKTPVRKLSKEASDDDKAMFDELTKAVDINTVMSVGNEFFNLFKYTAVEPFLDRGKPQMRVLPSDRFIVLSTNKVNPLRPTHFSKIMGTISVDAGEERLIFYSYTDTEFLIHDDKEEIYHGMMSAAGNPEGINPLGRLPISYINRSRHDLVPTEDTDTLAMTVLIPLLLSDLNFAVKFQCFSLIYIINGTSEGLKISPNAVWAVKSDSDDGKSPVVGTINPTVDTDKALAMIKTELAFWMQSRNIKPGAIGDMSLENAASGFAKMIDEMDTSEDRQKQVPYFMTAEDDVFDLLKRSHDMVWIDDPEYTLTKMKFSDGITLSTQFAEQRPMVDSSKVLADEVMKLTQPKPLTTWKRALKTLNPDMSEEEIDALAEEILEEVGQMQKDAAPDAADQAEGDDENAPPEESMDASELQGAPAGGSGAGAKK